MSANFTGLENWTINDTTCVSSIPSSQGRVTLIIVSFVGVVAVITIIYNSIIVAAFIKDVRIRTPFNYYILNLTFADLCMALFVMPVFIRNRLISTWPYSRALCMFLQFCSWTCSGAGAHAVMWISLDRMWCLYKPLHYHNNHSKKLTIAVCLSMWIYLTALTAPYTYLDQTRYLASNSTCRANVIAQPNYTLILEVTLYILPLVAVSATYSAVIMKLSERRKQRSTVRKIYPSEPDVGYAVEVAISQKRKKVRKEEKSTMKVLPWITTCMIVLWSPAAIFYITASYVKWVYSTTAVAIVICLENVSCVINPFIYHRNLPDIQVAIHDLFTRSR